MKTHVGKRKWRAGCGRPRPTAWTPKPGDMVRITADAAAELGCLLCRVGRVTAIRGSFARLKMGMLNEWAFDDREVVDFSDDADEVVIGVEQIESRW